MARKKSGGRKTALPKKELRPERRATAAHASPEGVSGSARSTRSAESSAKEAEAVARPRAGRNGRATGAGASRKRASGAAPAALERQDRRPRAGSDSTGKYVYCIIPSSERLSFGGIGIGAEPGEVYTVGYQDIAAVVSDAPLEVYDPTRENVLSHEGVNERVMQEYTVVPMSFGTVFKTADDIVELLRSAYGAFSDVLKKMENKLEFGLKVLWDPDEIIHAVEKEDESLRRLREEIRKQRGSTYFARMQYGRLVDSLLQERSEFYVREIFAGLRSVSVASRANKPIGERMIMNAAFLVSRDEEGEFDAAVKDIGGRYPHLTFKYTGPWPPYNFVNIRLKLERAEDAE